MSDLPWEIVTSGLIGGLVGGVFGVAAAIAAAYGGPRRLEEWRRDEESTRVTGPRKNLLMQLLCREDRAWWYLSTLARVSGTSENDCRRLLIEIGARGASVRETDEGEELWALIERKPLGEAVD